MAGGRGTRLSPLTAHLPKPMVPLLDRPCMEYIIDLLKRYGITEIAVTVQYLPQVIKNYFGDGSDFGVQLRFFEESTPLGTAGSVKNAEEFLDDTFIVISGDALTDFDLQTAIDFHRSRRALGTLVLTRVENPVEYGIVLLHEDGRIARFFEKPSWSEVFSNTANTGIYVLEPEVLHFFDKHEVYDFSKDLFPYLLKHNLPLYGIVANGYWSDIGNLVQYRQTQFDMLSGLVNVHIKGRQVVPGVWLGEEVKIHPSARITAPAFIGDGTVVDAGVQLQPYTVTGKYNRIEESSCIERSVLWNRSFIGRSAILEGATLCDAIRVDSAVKIHENAVIGSSTQIGKKAVVHANVKIWPNKHIGPDTIQRTSLIWGHTSLAHLFEDSCICGAANIDLTPEFSARIAGAYGAILPHGASVVVSADDDAYAAVLKYSVVASLLAAGVHVQDLGTALGPITRYVCRMSHLHGGIHIHRLHKSERDQVSIEFIDGQGLPIAKSLERKVENAFFQEDFARPDSGSIGSLEQLSNIRRAYIREIVARVNMAMVRQRKWTVVYGCETPSAMLLMQGLLEQLGCVSIMMVSDESSLCRMVTELKTDLGFYVEGGGKTLRVITEQGDYLTDTELDRIEEIRGFETAIQTVLPGSISLFYPPVRYDGFYKLAVLLNYLSINNLSAHGLIGASSVPLNASSR